MYMVSILRADSPPASAASLCDVIVEHVIGEFTRLKSTCSVDLGKVILASFVLEDSSQGTYSVISIGTGRLSLLALFITSLVTWDFIQFDLYIRQQK